MDMKLKEFESKLLSCMRCIVSRDEIVRVFKGQTRPNFQEMDLAINLAFANKPIPQDIQVKLEAVGPKEAFEDFCRDHGLKWDFDYETDNIILGLKEFPKKE